MSETYCVCAASRTPGGLLHVEVLRPRAMLFQSAAHLTYDDICLLCTLPDQFRVGGITSLALITGSIRVHRVQFLYVRLPHLGQQVLLLLGSQLRRKFGGDVIQDLVVHQRMSRINDDVAEDLEVDIGVQLFHQLLETQARVHLLENQGHFPFRSEV